MAPRKRKLWCEKCYEETEHRAYRDPNGEYIYFCQTENCGRFLKFDHLLEETEGQYNVKSAATEVSFFRKTLRRLGL